MFRDQAHELCQKLADETLERIRQDRRRVSVRVAALLERIEEHLLSSDLQVESLRRWCGQRDKNISTRFAEELGLAPWAYITQGRMEIAGRMLAASDLAVWRIGLAVGYDSGQSFSRAFKRWCGQSPSRFRGAALASADEATQVPAPAEPLSREAIRQALAGDLPDAEAELLVGRLDAVRLRIATNYPTLTPVVAEQERIEPLMASRLWRQIEPLPSATRQAAVRSQAPAFHTPALFHLFCTESIDAESGTRALQMASLALISVFALVKRHGPGAGNWMARSYVVTGYAMYRADYRLDASQCFAVATRMLDHLADEAHPIVVLELCFYSALLAIARHDFKAARLLTKNAVDVHAALKIYLKRRGEAAEAATAASI